MNDTLLGADPTRLSATYGEERGSSSIPTQLRVGDEVLPGLAHVGKEWLDLLAYKAARDLFDRRADNVVTATNGEGHAMADEARIGV